MAILNNGTQFYQAIRDIERECEASLLFPRNVRPTKIGGQRGTVVKYEFHLPDDAESPSDAALNAVNNFVKERLMPAVPMGMRVCLAYAEGCLSLETKPAAVYQAWHGFSRSTLAQLAKDAAQRHHRYNTACEAAASLLRQTDADVEERTKAELLQEIRSNLQALGFRTQEARSPNQVITLHTGA